MERQKTHTGTPDGIAAVVRWANLCVALVPLLPNVRLHMPTLEEQATRAERWESFKKRRWWQRR